MKSVIFASLVASAAAFAPAAQQQSSASSSSALRESPFAKEMGAQAPLGFWDPMNFLEGLSKEDFDELRFKELKHGRIAMLAFLGYITPLAGFRFPGMLSSDLAFADIPAGLEGLRMVPTAGLAQIAIFIACMEIGTSTFNGKGEFLGDYTVAPGMDKFRWDTKSDDWKYKKMQIELNNGRAAQMGILGLVTHELMGNLNEVLYV